MSLKFKVGSVLSFLVLINSVYFYVAVASIADLNGLVFSLYDKVVMSSTYSQMVKNDFLRYSSVVSQTLTESGPAAAAERARSVDLAASFRENLDIVKERSLLGDPNVDAVGALFENLKPHAERLLAARPRSPAEVISLLREWSVDPRRLELIGKLTDLTDKIVADGYDFRVSSEMRTRAIKKTTIVFSLAILLLNVLCLGFIFASILPRLKKLTAACVDIAAGQFNRRVNLNATDEFGRLADAFNVMLEALRRSEDQIQAQLLSTRAMMDSLGQGYFSIDRTGLCQPVFSRACLDLLESAPAGQPAGRVLGVPEVERTDFDDWLDVLFNDVGTFEDMANLGPAKYPHRAGRTIKLEYKPMRDQAGTLINVVVVATDQTAEVRAREDAGREQEFSRMITKLFNDRGEFTRFLGDARRMIASLEGSALGTALRTLHTLKGGAAIFALRILKEAAHAGETAIARSRAIGAGEDQIRREITAVAESLRLDYESVLKDLKEHASFDLDEDLYVREIPLDALTAFHRLLVTQAAPVELRHVFQRDFLFEPISKLLRPFDEAMREIGERQGKRLRAMNVVGGDLAVPREPYRALFASLVHVFRNAVDHGIETPDERAAAGKDPAASVNVTVERHQTASDGSILISIADDGRGIDVEGLRRRLIERGVSVAGESDHDVLQHVFDSGVSTAANVTDVSGRGIGMDAVRAAAQALGGRAWVETATQRGTTVWIEVPDVDLGTAPAFTT